MFWTQSNYLWDILNVAHCFFIRSSVGFSEYHLHFPHGSKEWDILNLQKT